MSDEDSVEAHEILSTFPDAALPILSTQQQQCDHDKHFFVFSSAGKPIYSYRGDEESLSSLMATAKALLSVAESRSESLRYIRYDRNLTISPVPLTNTLNTHPYSTEGAISSFHSSIAAPYAS